MKLPDHIFFRASQHHKYIPREDCIVRLRIRDNACIRYKLVRSNLQGRQLNTFVHQCLKIDFEENFQCFLITENLQNFKYLYDTSKY